MVNVEVRRGEDIGHELIEEIVAFDRVNIGLLLEELGQPFPEDRRRIGLRAESTTLLTLREGHGLLGYLDFCRSWSDERDIYVSSLQVVAPYRNTRVAALLIARCARLLRELDFRYVVSEVHRENHRALRLYRRLGLTIIDRGTPLLGIRATKDTLDRISEERFYSLVMDRF